MSASTNPSFPPGIASKAFSGYFPYNLASSSLEALGYISLTIFKRKILFSKHRRNLFGSIFSHIIIFCCAVVNLAAYSANTRKISRFTIGIINLSYFFQLIREDSILTLRSINMFSPWVWIAATAICPQTRRPLRDRNPVPHSGSRPGSPLHGPVGSSPPASRTRTRHQLILDSVIRPTFTRTQVPVPGPESIKPEFFLEVSRSRKSRFFVRRPSHTMEVLSVAPVFSLPKTSLYGGELSGFSRICPTFLSWSKNETNCVSIEKCFPHLPIVTKFINVFALFCPGVRDDMVTGCVSALARRLETELRAAKSAQLACGEVLLPPDLLQRVAADVFALAEVEPCGIRGCTLYVEFLSADLQNCRRIATVKWDPNTVSTFELTLTLKQDPRSASWTSILPQFIK